MAIESGAGTYAELAGIEIVNNSRVMAYLEKGLGPSSLNVYGECGSCGCPNLYDLIGCHPDLVGDLDQCIDLPGISGNYISTPDTPENSLQGTDSVLSLSGTSGTFASTPDSPSLSITGNIDLRIKVALDDWTPSAAKILISKWFPGQQSYEFYVGLDGTLRLGTSIDGVNYSATGISTVPTGLADGEVKWVRVSLDVDDGAGNRVYNFYTSDDGITWTPLGATVTNTGTTTIFNSTAATVIGAEETPWGDLPGYVYEAEIISDGVTVANPDFTASPWVIGDVAPTAREDAAGNVWSLNGDAEIIAQSLRQSLRLPGTAGSYASTPDSSELSLAGDNVLYLPGIVGNYASTPDSAANSITGDIDIRVRLDDADTSTLTKVIIAKWAASPNRGWLLRHHSTNPNHLEFLWSTTGSNAVGSTSAVPTPAGTKWVRATLAVATGQVSFYTSSDGVTWVLLNAPVAVGATSIFDAAAQLQIGNEEATAGRELTGNVYYAEIRNGINGSIAAAFDPSTISPTVDRLPTTLVSPINGETWTMNGTRWNWRRDNEVRSLRLSGANASASTPDSVALSIAGDIDIRVKVAADDWTPAGIQILMAKFGSAGNRSWRFYISASGALHFEWTVDGTALINRAVSSPGFTDGSIQWIRVTLDVDNGAAGHTATFYTSTDGANWSIVAAPIITAGVTSIFDSTAPIEVGIREITVEDFVGNVLYAEVRNGIDGTIVANPSFENQPWDVGETGGATGTDVAGNTWTLNGAAIIQRAFASDLDIRVKVALDDWTPSPAMTFVSKYGTSTQFSFRFRTITAGGNLVFEWSANGAVVFLTNSTAGQTNVDGSTNWVRVTLDADNGVGQREVKFYTSTDGVVWIQLGATVVTAGVAAIYDGPTVLEVGSAQTGTGTLLAGNVYKADVRNNILDDGTGILTNPDFTNRPWEIGDTGGATGADTIGNTWTLQSNAIIQGGFSSDLDIRAKVALDDWTPTSLHQTVVSKWNATGDQISWAFQVSSISGTLRLDWSPTGAIGNAMGFQSTVGTGFVDGTAHWIRVTFDVDDGSGNRVGNFYTSSDGLSWVQLGSTITVAATTVIFDSTTDLVVGGREENSNLLAGHVYYAELRNGIDGDIVAVFDTDDELATSPTTPNQVTSDTTGEVWTINGSEWVWGCDVAYNYPYYPFVAPDEYTSPEVDNAPWYTSDIPESADFLGFFAEEFTGLDSPFEREVVESVNNGGILSRSRLKTRELTWKGFLFGATCCSVQYGLRWLSKTLSRFGAPCRDCFGDDLEFLYCCPSVSGEIEPFRTLKGVGLIEGPLIESERATCRSSCSNGCGGSCIIEIEFTLVATQPYLYSRPIPIYDCVNLYEGSVTPYTDATSDCGPFDCSDTFFDSLEGICPLPALPPTAEYTNNCAPVFTTPLANYYSVTNGSWNDLEEVVPVISISSGSISLGGIVLGFYSSKSGNPCGDLSLFPPNCDVVCDDLTIIALPANSTFYIDGRTRKMAIICSDGSAFPGERLTTGPWSWPSFDCYGFCMEVRFEGDIGFIDHTERARLSCVSLSLVPRSF